MPSKMNDNLLTKASAISFLLEAEACNVMTCKYYCVNLYI